MAQEQLGRPLLVLDGGLGTSLEDEHGVHFSSATTPLWSSYLLVSSPETLLTAQTAFARAGAHVLLTATYQASFEGFRRTPRPPPPHEPGPGPSSYTRAEAATYMRSAVAMARTAFRAAGRPHGLVALSLGAYGATMRPSQEYTGQYGTEFRDVGALYHFHLDRLACFADDAATWADIDLVAFETLPRRAEVEAVRMVMDTIHQTRTSSKDFWISCVFPRGDDELLPDGSTISEVVVAMLSE
jgi:homocysteine S-methyltransferase